VELRPEFIVQCACVSCQVSWRRMMDFQKRTRAVAGDSTVSSRRMAAFTRSCSMVVGHSSASCQTELRVVLFCGTDADVVIELKPVWA
jgi:hypothetical protein